MRRQDEEGQDRKGYFQLNGFWEVEMKVIELGGPKHFDPDSLLIFNKVPDFSLTLEMVATVCLQQTEAAFSAHHI